MMTTFVVLLNLFAITYCATEVTVKETGVYVPLQPKTECLNVGPLSRLSNIAPKLNELLNNGPKCVYFPPGLYMSSDIHPKSDVTLVLDKGCVIKAIPGDTVHGLVHAVGISRFGIIGDGMLHGNAENMWTDFSIADNRMNPRTDVPRPRALMVENVNGALFQDIHVHNSSFWSVHVLASSNVRMDNLDVYGDSRFPNNDGIDPDASVNVTIVNSRVAVADDGVCPKARVGRGPLRNLYVQNVTIRSSSHAIKFGTDTCQEMHDILFDNIKIYDSNSGLAIQMRCNGSVHDVTWSNIDIETRYYGPRWWGNGEPISFTAEPRGTNPLASSIGQIYNHRFINITARSENGAFISGKTHGLYGFTFDNVSIELDHWSNYSLPGAATCIDAKYSNDSTHETTFTDCRGSVDRRPALEAVGYNVRFPSKSVPFRIENAKGLRLNGITGKYNVGDRPRPSYWGSGACIDLINVELSEESGISCPGSAQIA